MPFIQCTNNSINIIIIIIISNSSIILWQLIKTISELIIIPSVNHMMAVVFSISIFVCVFECVFDQVNQFEQIRLFSRGSNTHYFGLLHFSLL